MKPASRDHSMLEWIHVKVAHQYRSLVAYLLFPGDDLTAQFSALIPWLSSDEYNLLGR